MFFVFTGRGQNLCIDSSQKSCASNSFCAYHYYFGSNTIYAAIPYGASFTCNPWSGPNGNDAELAINTSSHEEIEMATDPLLNAWTDSTGSETGDKCNWQFGSLDAVGGDVVWNSHEYIVQKEWDNATSSCRLLYSLPGTWPQCAGENGTCSFSGTLTVAYGANGKYFYRVFSNGVACNHNVFGDPDFGIVKACYLEPIPPASNVWTRCASENSTCSFSGTLTIAYSGTLTIAYGANGQFNYATLNNGTACNNGIFGDPAFGTVKTCYLMTAPPDTVSWTRCAGESSTCSFSGNRQVAYGANGQFFYGNMSNGTTCSNSVFGDPVFGVVKACYYD